MSSSSLGTLPSCPSGAYPIPWGGLWVSLCPLLGYQPFREIPSDRVAGLLVSVVVDTVFSLPDHARLCCRRMGGSPATGL